MSFFILQRVIFSKDVDESIQASFSVAASPNPFLNDFKLQINTVNSGKYSLRLRDTEGRLIWKDKVNLASGENEFTIEADRLKLADGIYIMEVEGKKGQYQLIKLLKAKP